MGGNVLQRKHSVKETFCNGNFMLVNLLWQETYCGGNILCWKLFVIEETFCDRKRFLETFCGETFLEGNFRGKTVCKLSRYQFLDIKTRLS